jgi:EAL domain-containing protein (putative c-di-GMP-specific phosphodiesterase class I)
MMSVIPEQLSLLDAVDEVILSTASIIASRPVVDLRNRQVTAYEYIACDHYSFLPNQNILSAVDLQHILETSGLLSLPEILLSVPTDIFVELDLSNQMAWALRALLSKGTHISILLSAIDNKAAINAVSSAMQNWRRVGCSVGIDGFGYAAVPALWPLVHNVDVVRFDPRLIGMVRAHVIPALPAQKLVNLVASMGISRIIVDGSLLIDDAIMFQEAGATHGQGPVFGEFSLTQPH